MIAKNEEKNIERCINSYKEIVDEIIVVDTGSADNTIAIAKKLGAKVFNYNWKDDFAAAKNYALSKAIGDWIIFLDADEYFDKQKSKNIPRIIKKLNNSIDAIICKIINIDKERKIILDENITIRIFKKKNIKYKNKIHEKLCKKSSELNCISISISKLGIYHTGYSKNIIERKLKRNLKLLLSEFEKGDRSPLMYYYLSDCYYGLQEYEKVIECAKYSIDNGFDVYGYKIKPYQNILSSMFELNYEEESMKKIIDKTKNEFPNCPLAYIYEAWINHKYKKYDEALKSYMETIRINNKFNGEEVNFVCGITHEIYFNMAKIYDLKNDYVNSIDCLVKSLINNKYYEDSFSMLINLIKGEKIEESILLLNTIYDKNDEQDIKFLVENLSKEKISLLLAYYNNIWMKQFKKEDSSIMYTLLANGKYYKAFQLFFECYLQKYDGVTAIFSIVSAMESKNKEYLLKLNQVVKPSFKRIICAYLNEKFNGFIKEDIDDYLTILNEVILLNNIEIIDKYVLLKRYFPENISYSIGNIFVNNRLYKKAIIQYKEAMKSKKIYKNLIKKVFMCIGNCYYKLHDYENAIEYFLQAINNGYTDNDIFEFLNWIYIQCNNDNIRKKILSISN